MHVFVVHSHITYYAALSVIRHLGIKDKDVLLLTGRKYKNPGNKFHEFSLGSLIEEMLDINVWNFYKFWKYIKIVDKIIDEEIRADYVLYIPHFSHPLMQMLATRPQCKSVNFIEEGTASYTETFTKKATGITPLLKKWCLHTLNITGIYGFRRFYNLTYFDTRFIERKVDDYFGFFKGSFPFLEKRRGRGAQVLEIYRETGFFFKPQYPALFLLEAGVEHGHMNGEKYLETLEFILEDFKTSEKTFSIKFHPGQKQAARAQILQLFQVHGFTIEVIPDEIPIEQLLLSGDKYTVVGVYSSLLWYGAVFGHKVFSYDAHLQKIDDTFREFRLKQDFDFSDIISTSNQHA